MLSEKEFWDQLEMSSMNKGGGGGDQLALHFPTLVWIREANVYLQLMS